MNEWLKLGLTIGGVLVAMYVLQQQQEYRLTKLETSLEKHLERHEEQNISIQKTLMQIQIKLGQMVSDPNG